MHTRPLITLTSIAAITFLCITSCDQAATEQDSPSTAAPSATTQPAGEDLAAVDRMTNRNDTPAAGELPPGHPPISSGEQTTPQQPALPPGHSPMGNPLPGATLTYDVPDAWQEVPPESSMRKAQFNIPGPGETPPGEVAVFHFPGAGGSVAANIDRWVAQFVTAEGEPIPPEQVSRESFKVDDLEVHIVELTGRFAASPMMGGTGEPTEEQYGLLGSIIETPQGPWFFKGVGPAETMQAAKDDFLKLMKSVEVE